MGSIPPTLSPLTIIDCRFAGTDSVFVTAGTDGVNFYVDEGSSFLGSKAMRCYEKREGYYQGRGSEAEGVVATSLCRFERKEECIVGTALGHLTLWKGRCCSQLLSSHTGAVTAVTYSKPSGLLVSGGKDSIIKLYKVAITTAGGCSNRGPQVLEERVLQVVGVIDLFTLDAGLDLNVRSLCIHKSGMKILVGLNGGELRELASDILLKSRVREVPVVEDEKATIDLGRGEEKGEENPEVPEGESIPQPEPQAEEDPEVVAGRAEAAAKEAKARRLGDDINGGPVVSAHWAGGKGTGVCLIKNSAGGFISSGTIQCLHVVFCALFCYDDHNFVNNLTAAFNFSN